MSVASINNRPTTSAGFRSQTPHPLSPRTQLINVQARVHFSTKVAVIPAPIPLKFTAEPLELLPIVTTHLPATTDAPQSASTNSPKSFTPPPNVLSPANSGNPAINSPSLTVVPLSPPTQRLPTANVTVIAFTPPNPPAVILSLEEEEKREKDAEDKFVNRVSGSTKCVIYCALLTGAFTTAWFQYVAKLNANEQRARDIFFSTPDPIALQNNTEYQELVASNTQRSEFYKVTWIPAFWGSMLTPSLNAFYNLDVMENFKKPEEIIYVWQNVLATTTRKVARAAVVAISVGTVIAGAFESQEPDLRGSAVISMAIGAAGTAVSVMPQRLLKKVNDVAVSYLKSVYNGSKSFYKKFCCL